MKEERNLLHMTIDRVPHSPILFYAPFSKTARENIISHFGLADDVNLFDFFGMPMQHDVYPYFAIEGDPENDFDYWRYYRDMDIKPGSFLTMDGVMHEPGSLFHFTHMVAPLRHAETVEEINTFPISKVAPGSFEKMKAEVDALHERRLFAECWVGSFFEAAWQIRDIERFYMDMIEAPEMCYALLDKIAERVYMTGELAARAGIDLIRSGDDIADQNGMLMSPKVCREMILSYHRELYRRVKSINPRIGIWYHSDGNPFCMIEDLIDIGVEILNPIQPECMDIYEVKRRYGDSVSFDGLIGTQSTMPFGTPGDVRDTVLRIRDDFGDNGGLILSPTHVIEPEVPVENIIAFVEACKE